MQTSMITMLKATVPLTYRCESCGEEVRFVCTVTDTNTGYSTTAVSMDGASFLSGSKIIMNKKISEYGRMFNGERNYVKLHRFLKAAANREAGVCPFCKKEQYWFTYAMDGGKFFGKRKAQKEFEQRRRKAAFECVPVLHVEERSDPELIH